MVSTGITKVNLMSRATSARKISHRGYPCTILTIVRKIRTPRTLNAVTNGSPIENPGMVREGVQETINTPMTVK